MTFEIKINTAETIILDQATLSKYPIVKLNDNLYQIRIGHKNYECAIYPSENSKKSIVKVNSQEYKIEIKDDLDLLLSKMGLNEVPKINASDVYSPMPGLVLKCMVKEGDTIEKDQQLLILEAMKMENIIKAQGSGVVEKVMVKEGDKVEKSQLLVSIKQ